MMEFKLVTMPYLNQVMDIIKDAKELLKKDSLQWQLGYPNEQTMINDINQHRLYGAFLDNQLLGICAVIQGIDPSYIKIEGKWLNNPSTNDLVIHRLAVGKRYHHQGVSKFLIEKVKDLAIKTNCSSIKIDTHEKNLTMQHIVSSLNFKKCGIIYLVDNLVDPKRLAYEYNLK